LLTYGEEAEAENVVDAEGFELQDDGRQVGALHLRHRGGRQLLIVLLWWKDTGRGGKSLFSILYALRCLVIHSEWHFCSYPNYYAGNLAIMKLVLFAKSSISIEVI